jgi:hypothetical protein
MALLPAKHIGSPSRRATLVPALGRSVAGIYQAMPLLHP